MTGGGAARDGPPTTRYARSGDLAIAYQVVGSGDLDLVVAPGSSRTWSGPGRSPACGTFLERLASFSRLILFDKRGTGLSDPVAGPATLEERVDDLRAVMDAAGSEQAALLGVSEGGAMAMLFAAQHPERTRALVLYGATARFTRAPDYPYGSDETELEDLFDRIVDRWGDGVAFGAWAPSRRNDASLRRWWGGLQRLGASPGMARRLFGMYPHADVRGILDAIHVPTLILHRRDDRLLHIEVARYLAEHIPGARLVELDGEDHLFFVGDVDQPLAEIEEFLTGVPARRRRAGAGTGDRAVRRRRRLHRAGGPDRRRLVGVDPGLVPGRGPRGAGAVLRERRSTSPGTGCSPPSPVRRGPSAAPWRSGGRSVHWGSRCGPACTRARWSGRPAAASPVSRCTSARA